MLKLAVPCAWKLISKRLQGETVVPPAWFSKPGHDGGFKQ
jgi:hypothetical protein